MKNLRFILAVISISIGAANVFAQNPPAPNGSQSAAESDSKLSELIARNLTRLQDKTQITGEHRRQAYAKLLEGQRYIWSISRSRSKAAVTTNALLTRQALQKAVELDSNLAEG